MRLVVLLTTRNSGDGLATVLHHLARGLDRMDRLVIVDVGSQDGTRARLRAFSEGPGRGAHILHLEPDEAPPATVRAIARRVTGAEYVLALGQGELLCAGVTAALEARLQTARPDVMICNHGWWVAGPSSPLSGPDAVRLAELAAEEAPVPPERYFGLFPDPRRLLMHDPETEEQCRQVIQAGDLGRQWACYDAVIGAASTVALFGDPVILRPLPECRVVLALTAALAALKLPAQRAEHAQILARLLPRIADELTQVDPAGSDAVIAGAKDVAQALSWRVRRSLRTISGPAARLLVAAGAGDHATAAAIVAQQAAARDRACMRALRGEISQLRVDIDRALPGPDYLMELYERVRPR